MTPRSRVVRACGALLGVAVLALVSACSALTDPAADSATAAVPGPPVVPAVSLRDQPGPARLGAVRMVSEAAGWATLLTPRGRFGGLVSTRDSGRTWTRVPLPSRCGAAMPAGDTLDTAWAAGSGSRHGADPEVTVCRTVDSGQHWAVMGSFTARGELGDLQFLDQQHGWLTTAVHRGGVFSRTTYHVWRTVDAGRHWRDVATSRRACRASLRMVSLRRGWLAGGCFIGTAASGTWGHYVAQTSDGGGHWTDVAVPHPVVGGLRAGCRASHACSYQLVDADRHRLVLATDRALFVRRPHAWSVRALPTRAGTLTAGPDGLLVASRPEGLTVRVSHDLGHTWGSAAWLPGHASGTLDVAGTAVRAVVSGGFLVRMRPDGSWAVVDAWRR